MNKNNCRFTIAFFVISSFILSIIFIVAQYVHDPISVLEANQNNSLCKLEKETEVKICYAINPFKMIKQNGTWHPIKGDLK